MKPLGLQQRGARWRGELAGHEVASILGDAAGLVGIGGKGQVVTHFQKVTIFAARREAHGLRFVG
jgi:hypothetical protein